MSTPVKTDLQHTFFALALVLLAGWLVDLVLWPAQALPPVTAVEAGDYFTEQVIERADAFRGAQSWLSLASMLVWIGVPLLVALRWPKGLGAVWAEAGRVRRCAYAAAAAGAVILLARVIALPIEIVAFRRSRNAGLAVQSIQSWLTGWAMGTGLTVLAIAVLAVVAHLLIRRLRRAWWAAFWAVVVLLAAAFQLFSPVVIAPLFADFGELPPSVTRSDVEQLARATDVRAGEILVVDAAVRTTAANAYVGGLGATKRVVLYDTLLRGFDRRQQRQVIAHEFGHAHYNDLTRGLVWFGLVAVVVLPAVDLAARRIARRRVVDPASPVYVVMLTATAILAIAVTQPAANSYSRAVEARADVFAMRATGDPGGAISLTRRLALKNLSRPSPPRLLHVALGTHPTPVERIGLAETLARRKSGR
ncbi:MAG: M48 family metalloprotease [Solirubrobacterales bacterium]